MVPNFHIITANFIPETPSRDERIKISSLRFHDYVTINYHCDYTINEQVEMWLNLHGFNIIGKGEGKKGWIFISSTFEPLIKPVK